MAKKRFKINGKRIRNFDNVIVGDWIFMKMRDGSGVIYKGFITGKAAYDDARAHFIGYYEYDGRWINKSNEFTIYTDSSNYEIYKENDYTLNDFDYEAKRHLIDLTLMTNDVEWFKELTN